MYQLVLPAIYMPWARACLASCKIDKKSILVVDNSVENKGVAASWNLGIDKMYERGADWLVLCSESNRFGDKGGLDFIQELDSSEFDIVETGLGMGWHLIAFNRRVFDTIGWFDENFYPGYFEDVDFGHRLNLGMPNAVKKMPVVDMSCAGWGHVPTLMQFNPKTEEIKEYIISKWGDYKECKYDHPFNDPTKDIKYWPNASVKINRGFENELPTA